MATFTITTDTGNTAPNLKDYSCSISNRETTTLQLSQFNSVYSDAEGDLLNSIEITALPSTGTLQLNGVAVTVNQIISQADISSGLLQFVPPNVDTSSSTSFTYRAEDTSNSWSNTASFAITAGKKVVATNYPPTVGDKDFSIAHAGTITFTQANFTTETSPAYYDPEGDAAAHLYIVSLPTNGTLTLSGVAVTAGQKIAVTSIPNLVYTADSTISSAQIESFRFTIEDAGSAQQSNEGFVSIEVKAKEQTAPTVDGKVLTIDAQTYQFSVADFTTNFADANNDSYYKVQITSLPSIGTLKYLGNPITAGKEIILSNISGLKYHLPVNYTIENGIIFRYEKDPAVIVTEHQNQGYLLQSHQDGIMIFENDSAQQVKIEGEVPLIIKFRFQTSDNSSAYLYSPERTNSFTGSGNVNVQPPYQNKLPTVSDNDITVSRQGTHKLTREMFLADYNDAEGDSPHRIKVLSLPTNGTILLSGVAVTVDQEVLFTDIDSELLTFDPDDTTTVVNVVFEFQVLGIDN